MPQHPYLVNIFRESEWTALMQAPTQAIMAVLLAYRTDSVTLLLAAKAAVQVLTEEQQRQDISSELVKLLLDFMRETDRKENSQGYELLLRKNFRILGQMHALNNVSGGREVALTHCRQVASILSSKVTALQAEEFKAWLLSIARKVTNLFEVICFESDCNQIPSEKYIALSELKKALDLEGDSSDSSKS